MTLAIMGFNMALGAAGMCWLARAAASLASAISCAARCAARSRSALSLASSSSVGTRWACCVASCIMARAMSLTGSWLSGVVFSDALDDALTEDDVYGLSPCEGDASNEGSIVDALLVLWL